MLLIGLAVLAIVIRVFPARQAERKYHWARNEAHSSGEAHAFPIPSSDPRDVLSILKGVNDPEINISIVDLGLIYDVGVQGGDVNVTMTLTSPKCPMAGTLIEEVKRALFANPSVRSVQLRVTFDPPWTIDRISPEAREKFLGISRGPETGEEIP